MALPKLNTPTYTGKIPSTGQTIEYRPFQVREQKILLLALESRSDDQIYTAFRNIIDICVTSPKEFKADNLASFDAESVFLQISGKSRGETSELLLACSHCEAKNPVKVVIDDVVLKNHQKTSNKNNTTRIQLTPDVGIELQYPSLKNVITQQQQKDGNEEKQSDIDVAFSMIRSSIKSIYDADDVYLAEDTSPEELNEFLESLTTEQMNKIEQFFEKMPYLAMDKKFKCRECGELNEIELKGIQSFF